MNKRFEFTEEQQLRIKSGYQDLNISTNKLAAEMNCSQPTIINFLRRNGIEVSNASEFKAKKYGKEIKVSIDHSVKNDYYVYFHRNKATGDVFYVGKGRNQRHKSKTNRSSAWLEYTANNEYVIEIHKDNLSSQEAITLESELISEMQGLININVSNKVALSKEECSRYFKYSPECSSRLERIAGKWNGFYHNGIIGPAGYLYHYKNLNIYYWKVKFNNKSIAVHRIIWTLFNGDAPDGFIIDHIDGDSTNNRIENLRCITQAENCRNKNKSSNNTSGATGITWFNEDNDLCGYRAICSFDHNKISKRFYVHKHGLLPAFALAVEWRKQKIKELNEQGAGYSDRHGT